MATSGSTDFSATRTDLIRQAALKLHAIDINETMSSQMVSDFSFALNAMVKRWSAKGVHVWTTREATLFPQPAQIKYALATSSTDHCTESYVATTLSAAEAAGQTALSVTDDDGISNADYIGIVLDAGSIHWSTVSGAPAGDVVTIADALPTAAAAAQPVFAYTTKIVRPLRIVDARRYNIAGARETPIAPMMARLDYQSLPNKTQAGIVNQCFYDPQLATGYLYLWQAPPTTITDLLKFTWHRPIEDFDAAGDNPDLPQEWIDTLIYNLAVAKAVDFDVPTERFAMVKGLADEFLDDVTGFDREAESIYFQPDFSGR